MPPIKVTHHLYLALGANLGDRLEQLQWGRARCSERIFSGEVTSAPIYETTPINCPPGSPSFYNTVIRGQTSKSPKEILALTQSFEIKAGRKKVDLPPNSPRPLDLDLLLLGDICWEDDLLVLPHPRLQERLFVLQPLSDLCPTLPLPPSFERTVKAQLDFILAHESPPLDTPTKLLDIW
ncbi:MAG: 2-amino-4-hydroxy-6-hydroxymethyldihydropteridine diphosphokinase [Verrucomicrobiota bacterium]